VAAVIHPFTTFAMSADTIQIRTATRADAPAILALEALFPGDRMSARSVRNLLRSDSARIFVAEHGGGCVGNLVLLLPSRWRGARVYSLVVAPELRGQRIGERLVAMAEQAAVAAGRRRMMLEVRCDNVAAQALYRRMGYAVTASLPAYYEDGGDGLRFSKPLQATVLD
jgi:ribosomal protein S18 acetylase RimI-like enzyme